MQVLKNGSVLNTFGPSEMSADSTDDFVIYTRGTTIVDGLPKQLFELHTPSINGVQLNYTRFGTYVNIRTGIFDIPTNIDNIAVFAFGQPSAQGSMPVSGSASYQADLYGAVLIPDGTNTQFFTLGDGDGSATFNVNFASGLINTLINLETSSRDFGDLTGTGAILSGGPAFNGTLTGAANGSFTGAFFGPSAQEMGYVFQAENSEFVTYGNVFGVAPPPP